MNGPFQCIPVKVPVGVMLIVGCFPGGPSIIHPSDARSARADFQFLHFRSWSSVERLFTFAIPHPDRGTRHAGTQQKHASLRADRKLGQRKHARRKQQDIQSLADLFSVFRLDGTLAQPGDHDGADHAEQGKHV